MLFGRYVGCKISPLVSVALPPKGKGKKALRSADLWDSPLRSFQAILGEVARFNIDVRNLVRYGIWGLAGFSFVQ